MRGVKKLVMGVGINDLTYVTQSYENIDGKQKLVWICPFYSTWRSMLKRCYSSKYHKTHPTYTGCSVVEEWKSTSNFREWMSCQDWKGLQLDKDILTKGNNIYSPDTCVFVHGLVNAFLCNHIYGSGEFPIGVSLNKKSGSYVAQCRNPFTKKKECLGYFNFPQEAHQAWKSRKRELSIELANSEYVTDERVAKSLINRFI